MSSDLRKPITIALAAVFLTPALAQTASISLDDDYGDSYKATVTVTNDSASPISGWRVRMQLGGPIRSLWKAEVESGESDPDSFDFAIRNLSYNGSLAAGESTTFGLIVDPDNGTGPPSTLTAEALSSDPVDPGDPGGGPDESFNYADALRRSLWFYDAQRSGELPDGFRIPWRGDAGLSDGADVGIDLTGGFHDAGDHVKFGLPMAFSMTMLAWGAVEYPDGFSGCGELDELRSVLRWGADYLKRCHVRNPDGSTDVFYGQVGDGSLDHAWWGPPESMVMARPSFKIDATSPGSDLAAESAAALASIAMVIAPESPAEAAELIDHATALYEFADLHRGVYSDSIPAAAPFYRSWSGYQDELVWAAAWLYRATGDPAWLDRAKATYPAISGSYDWGLSWDDKRYGCYVLMAVLDGGETYRADAARWLDFWTIGHAEARVPYTPGGLAYLDAWGSLRYATTAAFCAFVHADHVADPDGRYSTFAKAQIDYALGSNPDRRSFVCGFGRNPPVNPHHRAAHASETGDILDPVTNTHVLYGALVGGPGPDDSYDDDRSNFQQSEVALDYNAAFTAALARLRSVSGDMVSDTFDQPEDPTIVFRENIDTFPTGAHTDDTWIPLWPGTKWANGPDEGRVEIDESIVAGDFGKSVRVLYPQGGQQSANSGAQWFTDLGGPHEELYMSYWVRFDEDFDFVLGGKLPGLGGAVSFEDRTHEWSGRLMWRENGKVEFYIHVPSDNLYDPGDRFWWNTEGFQATLVPGRWHHIELRLRLNAPGQFDGLMEGWFDGVKAASYPGFYFRDAPTADATIAWMFFSTFFGGSSSSIWQATKDEHARFDGFVVSRQRIGYPGPPPDADGDRLPDAWEVLHFGNTDSRADGDPDGDGQSNLDEHDGGTDPLDASDRTSLLLSPDDLRISLNAKAGRRYWLERSENLRTWTLLRSHGPLATDAALDFEDSEQGAATFYRVRTARP
ncbi:glycosylhydrolase [Haloferula helveola]|uniref:Endoglucanase n=1 Tax=Haloferula helveola TaxID=490095 RepID=A0ABM7RDA0_9BACT|nr:glycosylhydrolase [Haloferula helveola]